MPISSFLWSHQGSDEPSGLFAAGLETLLATNILIN